MNKSIITCALLALTCAITFSGAAAPKAGASVWAVDFVKPKEGQRENYLKYLEANWLKARAEAKRQGFVTSYKVLMLPAPGENDYSLLLITEYPDQKMYDAREANFKAVFAKTSPNGPTLINGLSSRQLADITSSKVFNEPAFANGN